jgi:hypothetical protein
VDRERRRVRLSSATEVTLSGNGRFASTDSDLVSSDLMDVERRRGPRGPTKLWIAVDGIDAQLRLRAGNVSASGVFFEHDKDIGEPGTVQWLYLSSADRIVSLQIMACVVRSVSVPGMGGSKLSGVALEFMPESDEALTQLRDFLHYVLALAADGVRAHDARVAARKAGVRSVVLETEWSLPVGAPVRVEIIARGIARTTRVEGRVVKTATISGSEPGEPLHRLEVAVQGELEGPMRRFSAQAMAAVVPRHKVDGPRRRFTPAHGLFFAPEPPEAAERRENDEYVNEALEGLLGTLLDLRGQPKSEPRSHLSGELERVRLPTLLSVFEMEKMTGELALQRTLGSGRDERTLFIRQGAVIDVEPLGSSLTPSGELRRVLSWDRGRFSFNMTGVDRVDRIATTTMALLLDFARETDEAKRSSPP